MKEAKNPPEQPVAQDHATPPDDMFMIPGSVLREMKDAIKDLNYRVHYVLNNGFTYGEEGWFCFPDGMTWFRKDFTK